MTRKAKKYLPNFFYPFIQIHMLHTIKWCNFCSRFRWTIIVLLEKLTPSVLYIMHLSLKWNFKYEYNYFMLVFRFIKWSIKDLKKNHLPLDALEVNWKTESKTICYSLIFKTQSNSYKTAIHTRFGINFHI